MNLDIKDELVERAALHAALGDPARLKIVDTLLLGDATASELGAQLAMASNLLAHHLRVLEDAGLLTRRRSEGDGRRSYLHLRASRLDTLGPSTVPTLPTPARLLFVCTANSARSQLATALWRRHSTIPAASAGTHPADRINTGAIATAGRHGLPLPRRRPQHLAAVRAHGDLVITVCDRAREELRLVGALHWSVPDPVPAASDAAFDAAYLDLDSRVAHLARRLATPPKDLA